MPILSDHEVNQLLLDVQPQAKKADSKSEADVTDNKEPDEEAPEESGYKAQLACNDPESFSRCI